jgi:hypothetical protein
MSIAGADQDWLPPSPKMITHGRRQYFYRAAG